MRIVKEQECGVIGKIGQAGNNAWYEGPLNLVLPGQCLHQQLFRQLQESGGALKRD